MNETSAKSPIAAPAARALERARPRPRVCDDSSELRASIDPLLDLRRGYSPEGEPGCAKPTLPTNGAATASTPSTIFSGNAASCHGAGPDTTRAASPGSYSDSWHGHLKCCTGASQSVTSQPVCVQTPEYATTPSAARERVSSDSALAAIRTTISWFRRVPSRTRRVAASIGNAVICFAPAATSASAIG